MHIDAIVSDTEHIPDKLNVIFDGLSRNVPPEDLGLDPSLMFQASTDTVVVQFIALCDPKHELTDMHSHIVLLQQCRQLLLI